MDMSKLCDGKVHFINSGVKKVSRQVYRGKFIFRTKCIAVLTVHYVMVAIHRNTDPIQILSSRDRLEVRSVLTDK